MPVLGMARLKITLHRKVTMIITAFVLPDLVHGVDLILGESWLKSHRVTLDYRTNKCIIHRPKGKINIKPCDSILLTPKSSWTAALSSAAAPVFSARQALRSLKRGAKPTLVLVREARTATGVMSAEADTGQATSCAGCSVSAAQPPQATIIPTITKSDSTGATTRVDLDPAKSVDGDAYPKKLVLGNDTSVLQKSSLTNQPPTDVVGLIPESALQALLGEYADVLSAPPEDREIGHIAVGHTIPLVPGAVPPFRRAPRLSPKEEAAARAHIAEMIKKKYISPSKSPYGAPILFITKPDGGLRVVCDYRMLNKLKIKNRYPLPRIDELLDHIGCRKIFSSLDLLDGYYQIAITPEDQHKTAFTTPFGHYECKVLAQGLCNSPWAEWTTGRPCKNCCSEGMAGSNQHYGITAVFGSCQLFSEIYSAIFLPGCTSNICSD